MTEAGPRVPRAGLGAQVLVHELSEEVYEDDLDLAAGKQDTDHLIVTGPLTKGGFNDGVMCP